MKEKPILFSAPMVRAILDGRKTMTRRVVKPQPYDDDFRVGLYHPTLEDRHGIYPGPETFGVSNSEWSIKCPYQPGMKLWVRETFNPGNYYPIYKADMPVLGGGIKWKPSIFMPRAASRIDLLIKSVRVERLQDITEEDAINEGINLRYDKDEDGLVIYDKRNVEAFKELWESINGKGSWEKNPFVWVIEFKKI